MNVDNEILSINDLVSDANNAFDKFEQIAEIAHKLLKEALADIDNVPTTKSQREILHLQANKVRNYRAVCEIIELINVNRAALRFDNYKHSWMTYETTKSQLSKSVLYDNDVQKDEIIIYAVND